MQEWEYKLEVCERASEVEFSANQLGKQGWELVSVQWDLGSSPSTSTEIPVHLFLFFKRPRSEEAEGEQGPTI